MLAFGTSYETHIIAILTRAVDGASLTCMSSSVLHITISHSLSHIGGTGVHLCHICMYSVYTL